jgi:hypothetical protein
LQDSKTMWGDAKQARAAQTTMANKRTISLEAKQKLLECTETMKTNIKEQRPMPFARAAASEGRGREEKRREEKRSEEKKRRETTAEVQWTRRTSAVSVRRVSRDLQMGHRYGCVALRCS